MLLKVFKEHVALHNLSPSEDQMTLLREAAQGALKYVELLEDFYRVTDLRYVGQGVKLGDAGSPVLLWRFKASQTYRVVYGDLSVRDVPPEDLPDFSGEKSSDLLKRSDAFRTYTCTYTVEYQGKPDRSYRLMRLSLSHRRETYADGRILVVDLSQKPVRMLELFPEEKRAVETTLASRGPTKDPDLLRMAVDLQDGTEDDLGVRQFEGRKARGFRAARPGNDLTFWVDPETELPTRVEIVHTGTGRKIIMSEFEFDVDFDESLFSTTAPEGYTVEKVDEKVEKGKVTEADLIEGLRAVAVFLDGQFPPGIGLSNLQKTLRQYIAQNNLSEQEVEKRLTPVSEKWTKAHWYTQRLRGELKVLNLSYVGEGVKLGDAKTPVIWWQPQGSETYRVIYADLSVKDVAPENLPK